MSIFYRPPDAVAGDFIPFFYQGTYHLFYLKDYRQRSISAYHTAWYHVVTRDFVTFEDWGEALSPNAADAQDASVWTGSVLEHDGQFSIYYTGHNHEYAGTGKPLQV